MVHADWVNDDLLKEHAEKYRQKAEDHRHSYCSLYELFGSKKFKVNSDVVEFLFGDVSDLQWRIAL